MMNPRVMLRELRRQERQTVSYIRGLGKQADLATKRFGTVPVQLAGALSDAKANLREIRSTIREYREKVTATDSVKEEE